MREGDHITREGSVIERRGYALLERSGSVKKGGGGI